MHLTAKDAATWLESEVRELLADDFATRIHFISLSSASTAWGRQWDYLIEIDLREGSDPNAVVRSAACASLLGDLRLLGMRPTVLVADEEHEITLMAGRG